MKNIFTFIFLYIFTFIFLYIFTFQVSFAGAAEQWTIEEVVYDNIGKNLTYTASKTGAAANDYIYKAKVPVTAAATGSTVAAMIRMGLAGAAIYGIVEGVGWIIENGVVKKKVKEEYDSDAYFFVPYLTDHFPTPEQAVKDFLSSQCSIDHPQYCSTSSVVCPVASGGSGTIYCNFYLPNGQSGRVNVDFRNVSKPPTSTYEPVPDSDLGAAVNNNPNAPNLLPDIYNPNNPAGGPAPKSMIDALDSANPIPKSAPTSDTKKNPNKDTNNDGKPDVYDPTEPDQGESTVWPEACNWFPSACEFFKVQKQDNKEIKENQKEQIAQDKTFFDKVSEWFDWTKEEPNNDDKDNEVELINESLPDVNTSILNADGQCPPDFSYPFPLPMGGTHTITYSYATVCYWFSKLYYVVVTVAWVIAFRIVTSTNMGNSNG